MDEHSDQAQLEMLTNIHNQLVDLKQILVEIELARPGGSQALQTRLRQIIATDQRLDAEGHTGAATKQQKVITPLDTNIEPGEALGGTANKQ